MQHQSPIATIFPVRLPLATNEHGVELSYIPMDGDNSSIRSNKNSLHDKCNSMSGYFEKIVKKISCFNVEKRGIERISPEDRTDSTIINTGMIWVRNIFHFSKTK